MTRKGYPFSKRTDKQMTNLVSGILTGLILAPFAIGSNTSNSSYTPSISDANNKPISRITAIVLIIIGIALIPLFIPLISFAFQLFNFPFLGVFAFFILISIPLVVWGGIIFLVIESFSNQNNITSKNIGQEKNTIQQQKDNQYDDLIKSLISQSSNPTYNSIRAFYFEVIKNNNKIHPEIIKLQKKIALHQKEKESNNTGRSYHHNFIDTSLQEIKEIELNHPECEPFSSYKEPVITIEDISDHITYPFFRGYIYIETNSIVSSEKPININESQLLIDKGMTFFNINSTPLKKLLGRDIEILFYHSFLMLLTKKDFVFVEYKDISTFYSEIALEVSSNYGSKFLNRTMYDCTPTVQIRDTKEYAIIEVGLLELEICSQKINLIFTKYKEGELIYNLIINNKQNIKRLIYEIISNNQRYLLASK